MAAERSDDSLTGDDVDRALSTALAVEPSPQFLARVRLRIASEPEPADWRFSWFAAAGACTMAVAISVTVINHPAASSGLAARAVGDLSFLPALLPGPLTIAASAPRRPRREKPTPQLQAIMKSNADVSIALATHIDEKNYDAIVEDAARLHRNFADSEPFWAAASLEPALVL